MLDECISFLKEKQKTTGNIEGLKSYDELFSAISAYIMTGNLSNAKLSIEYCFEHMQNDGSMKFKPIISSFGHDIGEWSPIDFLKVVCEYLSKTQNKSDVSNSIKYIRKSIKYIERYFDDVYLLFYREDIHLIKTFHTIDNAKIINFADTLVEILNKYKYIKEADKLFKIKGKIELGFARYLYFYKQKVLLSSFQPSTMILHHAKKSYVAEILMYYSFDIKFEEEFLSKYEKIIIKNINTWEIMILLIILKRKSEKKANNFFDDIAKYLKYYPEVIIKDNDKRLDLSIEKSIFPNFKDNVKSISNDKTILIGIENIKTASLIIMFLQ